MVAVARRSLVSLVLAFAASTALAQDIKTYPGTICAPMDGRQWSITEAANGNLRNASGGTVVYVGCALPTDDQGSAPVGELSVEVRAGQAGTFDCTAYSGDGAGVSRSYARSVSATDVYTQFLTLQWSGETIQRDPLAPVGVNCRLPPQTDIVRIVVKEQATAGLPDTKTMTGAQCKPMDGRQRDRLRVSALALANQSDQGTYVTCMLPTDGEEAYAGGSLAVTFLAGGVPGAVYCSAYSGDLVNGATSVAMHAYVYAFGRKTLQWEDNLAGGPSAPIGFNCRLPPYFKLTRIYWAEPVATRLP